ncbi:MAG: phosphotransferase [Oscillospiraceae bacterium]|nr:phosphotransferase [Oscillospiraceae bacterium]
MKLVKFLNNDLYTILNNYGFVPPLEIKPIYKDANVWKVNDNYILKKNNEEEKDIEKALMINSFLKKENIPAVEYIKTISGEYYTVFDGNIYSLMRKMRGEHIDPHNPFIGDYKSTAYRIGVEIARLHMVLKKMGNGVVYESDLMNELKGQILEIKDNNIDIPCEIINSCLEFDSTYHLLPRQLIHRDIHLGNMLFENDRLTCFLDFDSSQVNARLFDIAYFGQSLLFIIDNYKNGEFVARWIEFFSSLLYGYHSENMLYENEIKSIHRLCLAIQITFISYYSYLEEKRCLIPSRVDMLKWIYDNEKIFTFISFPDRKDRMVK